jgi:hypothetical protein
VAAFNNKHGAHEGVAWGVRLGDGIQAISDRGGIRVLGEAGERTNGEYAGNC